MANENTNNQNDIKSILTLPLMIVGVSIVIAIVLIATQIVPGISNYNSLTESYKQAQSEYEQISQSIEAYKNKNMAAERAASNTAGIDKGLFKPLEAGVDSESILAAEFSEILQLMTSNTIKTISVKYDYAPGDDNFYKNAQDKFSVCQLDMDMVASYNNFKNFMKDLYKHEHYLDIAKVEIKPYPKNKSILRINLTLKLYAEKI